MQAASLVVSGSAQAAAIAGEKLANHGLPVVSTLASTEAKHWLVKKSELFDVVFYDCTDDDNDSISVTQTLRQNTNKPIVAICNTNCSRRVMNLIRAGASDCVDSTAQFNNDLSECLQRLAKQPTLKSEGNVISVVAPAGGCGASTLAVNIALSLNNRSLRSNALIELNTASSAASYLLDIEPQHSLQSLSEHSEYLDSEMIDKAYSVHSSGLRLLASQRADYLGESRDVNLFANIVRWAKPLSEYVVVDCPSYLGMEYANTLRLSKWILVVFRLDFPCTMQCRELLASLDKLGISEERVVLVANRCNRRSDLSVPQVTKALGRDLEHRLPEDPVAAQAANIGNPIVSEFANSKLAAAISKLSSTLT